MLHRNYIWERVSNLRGKCLTEMGEGLERGKCTNRPEEVNRERERERETAKMERDVFRKEEGKKEGRKEKKERRKQSGM